MRTLILLTLTSLVLSSQTWAEAPECPTYANRHDCLASTDDNLQNMLRLIDEEASEEDQKNRLILAALDVNYFESQACLKTCVSEA